MLRSTHLRQVLFLPENGKTVSSGVPPAELEDLVVPLSGPGGATSPNFGNKLSRNPDGECSGKISCCTTRNLYTPFREGKELEKAWHRIRTHLVGERDSIQRIFSLSN